MKDNNLYKNLNEEITGASKSELIKRIFENKTKSLLLKKDYVKKMAEGGGLESQEVYTPYEFLHTLLPEVYGRPYVVSDSQAEIWDKEIEQSETELKDFISKNLLEKKVARIYDFEDKALIENIEIRRKALISRKSYITESELEAYLFCHPELDRSFYIKDDESTPKMTRSEFIKKGLIMIDFVWSEKGYGVKYIYRFEYLSGNLYKKISNLKKYRFDIIEQLKSIDDVEMINNQLDYQLSELEKNTPLKALITLDNYNRIYLHPKSEFCDRIFNIQVEDWRDTDEGSSSSLTLKGAFAWWSTYKMDSTLIKNVDSVKSLNKFYTDLERPSETKMNPREFINARRRAFKDGDNLFNVFLNEALSDDCKSRLQYQWNELYNNYTEQLFYKIPIALTLSKTFKTGQSFLPNETQIQSVQYIKDAGSGLLAYGVGVGKTASSILNVSYALDHGIAKKPLFVVPLPTYAKWIKEIQGGEEVSFIVSYIEDEKPLTSVFEDYSRAKKFSKSVNGEIKEEVKYIHGLLPHLPKVVGLENLNAKLVSEKLKVYSENDREQMSNIQELLEYLGELKISYDFQDSMVNAKIQSLYDDFELEQIQKEYNDYLAKEIKKQKTDEPKVISLLTFFIRIIQKYNRELPYILGDLKEFDDKTIFVCTYEALEKLGLKLNNDSDLGDNSSIFGKLFTELTQGEYIENYISMDKTSATGNSLQEVIYGIDDKRKLDINKFGWDFAVFDESHTFKKVFTESKGTPKEGYSQYPTGSGKVEREDRKYTIGSTDGSSTPRALSGWVLTRIIQMNNNGNNTIQLTATPFTNKPAEIFSMLALTNYKRLVESGYKYMQDFFDLFMQISYDLILTPSQKIVRREMLVGFNNLPQMRKLIYGIMDYKSGEDANIKRPEKILYPSVVEGRSTTLPATAQQEQLFKDIKQYVRGNMTYKEICATEEQTFDIEEATDDELLAYIEMYATDPQKEKYSILEMPLEEEVKEEIKRVVKKLTEKEGKEVVEENDIEDKDELAFVKILKGLSMLKQTTLSPYLSTCMKEAGIEPTPVQYVESSPKFLYTLKCIKSIHDFEEANNLYKSGIVIYMNIGVNPSFKGKSWSTGGFEKIKKYIVEEMGYSPNEISIINGKISNDQKEKEKNKFLAGQSTILIGSSTISTGVDLQNRSSGLFMCAFDWNPTDNEQINGRIHRQGNDFFKIRIAYPMIMNSADPIIFQLLNEKANRIKSIWDKDDKGTTLDLKDFDPNKFKKDLLDDPADKVVFWVEEQKTELEDENIILQNRLEGLRQSADDYSTLKETTPVMKGWLTVLDAFKKDKKKKEIEEKIGEKVQEAEDLFNEKKSELKEKLEADDDFGVEYGVEMKKAREKYEKAYAKATEGEYDYKNDPEGRFKVDDYYSLTNDELLVKINSQFGNTDSWYVKNIEEDYQTRNKLRNFFQEKFNRFARGYFTDDDSEYYRNFEIYESWAVRQATNSWKGAYRSDKKTREKLEILGISYDGLDEAKQMITDRITEITDEIKAIENKKSEMFEQFSLEAIERKKVAPTISERVDEFSQMNEILRGRGSAFASDKAKVVDTFEEKLDIKPKAEEVIIEEKGVSSEAEFLTDKIEVFTNLLELEEDESEIEFLNDKIDSFKNLLELEEDI